MKYKCITRKRKGVMCIKYSRGTFVLPCRLVHVKVNICWGILHENLSAEQQSRLTYGDASRAAGHGVDQAEQTQAAGRHGGAGAEDALVGGGPSVCGGGGCWLSGAAAGPRGLGGRSVSDGEGARLGAPLLQSEDHCQVVSCRERRRNCHGVSFKSKVLDGV